MFPHGGSHTDKYPQCSVKMEQKNSLWLFMTVTDSVKFAD